MVVVVADSAAIYESRVMLMVTHAICLPLESMAVIIPTYVPCKVIIFVQVNSVASLRVLSVNLIQVL